MDYSPEGVERQKQVEVDNKTYKFHIMMPSKAFDFAARLSKLVAEPLSTMAAAGGNEMKVTEVLPLAVRALMNNLHEDKAWRMIQELMNYASFDGKSINVDLHFVGQMGHLMKVVMKMVEYQFQDFFEAIGQTIAASGLGKM